jgi:hypothetical protein
MRRTGPGVLASLVLLCALAGCAGNGPVPAASTGAPALAAYTAPAGAPAFCSVLARAGSIRLLPAVLGRLSADPLDLAAPDAVLHSRSELASVLASMRTDRAPAAVATPLQDLVDALGSVALYGVDEESADRIRADLAAVGRAAQPLCAYPT